MEYLTNNEKPILVDPTRFVANEPKIDIDKKNFLIEQVVKTYSALQDRCESCPLSRLHIQVVEDRDNNILGTSSILCNGRLDPSNPNKKVFVKTNGFKLRGEPITEEIVDELLEINEKNLDVVNACGINREIIKNNTPEEYPSTSHSWKDMLTHATGAILNFYTNSTRI